MVKAAKKSGRRFARKNFESQFPSHICFEPLESRMLYSATPIQLVANANNQFAMDLFHQLGAEDGNMFFSPYSISTALDMVLQGAKGQTAQQIMNVLHLSTDDVAKAGAKALYQLLSADPAVSGYELSTANKLWGPEGFLVSAQFQRTVADLFGAALESIDFSDPEQAAATINAWVEAQTNGKITDLISPDMISPLTRLVLVNAIYFKGDWATPFEANSSTKSTFHLDDSTGQTVKMMHRKGNYDYYEDDKLQSIAIPYKNDGLEMVIMLPKSVSLDALNGSLNVDYLNTITSNYTTRKVQLSLPAFELSDSFHLQDTLSAMGMPIAFTRLADFSGIASERLVISKVVHKSYIKVDEKGTEAAAATAIIMSMTSAPDMEPPANFVANHPFLFAIRERTTGAILFMGRLSNADESAATFAATFTLSREDGVQQIPRPKPTLPGDIELIDNTVPTFNPRGFPSLLIPIVELFEPPVVEPVVEPVDETIEPTPISDNAWWAIAAPSPAMHHGVSAAPAIAYAPVAAVEFFVMSSTLEASTGVALAEFVATAPVQHTDYSPYYTYVGSDVVEQSAETQNQETMQERAESEEQQSASADKDDKDELFN